MSQNPSSPSERQSNPMREDPEVGPDTAGDKQNESAVPEPTKGGDGKPNLDC